MQKRFVDYATYHQLIDTVIQRVQQTDYRPDMVLGVARGGLLLADGLSRAFKVPMAVVMTSSYCGANGTQSGVLKISESIATVQPLQGRVLVADDLVDSGRTLAALMQHLRVVYPEVYELRSAVIWSREGALFDPDFSAQALSDANEWIVQPFEVRDFL